MVGRKGMGYEWPNDEIVEAFSMAQNKEFRDYTLSTGGRPNVEKIAYQLNNTRHAELLNQGIEVRTGKSLIAMFSQKRAVIKDLHTLA
jgi:hypothetical protein